MESILPLHKPMPRKHIPSISAQCITLRQKIMSQEIGNQSMTKILERLTRPIWPTFREFFRELTHLLVLSQSYL